MANFAIFVLVLMIAVNRYIEKKWLSLGTLFCGIWTVVIFLGELNLYGIKEYSERVYIILLIGSMGFMCGYWFVLLTRLNVKWAWNKHINRIPYLYLEDEPVESKVKYEINYPFVYVMSIISFAFYLKYTVKVISILRGGSTYVSIRNMYGSSGEGAIISSSIESTINGWVLFPFVFALIPILLLIIFERKGNKILIFLGLLNIFMYILFSGSRFIIANLLVAVIIMMIIYKVKISKKLKRRIIIALIVLSGLIVILTIFRYGAATTTGSEILESYYAYATLCLPLLDHWIEIVDASKIQTYGVTFFGGIITTISFVLARVGVPYPELLLETNDIVSQLQQFIRVFESRRYNTFVTLFYYFYLDFREIGVVLGSFVFGNICGGATKFLKKNQNYLTVAIYILVAQSVVKSIVRWEFFVSSYVVAFIFVRLCLKKREVLKEKV